MEIEIDDNHNKLSKTQKIKIRKMIKNNESKQKILNSIHYDNNIPPYQNYEIEIINHVKKKVIFSNDDPKDNLREKLKNKLHQYRIKRNNIYINEGWKKYYQVLQHPQIKNIPNDNLKSIVPNPDEIKKNVDIYRSIINKIPNPLIKDYINTCLSLS